MTGTEVIFKNVPQSDGSLRTIAISDCLVYNNGAPNARRPQIAVHLPKTDDSDVRGGFVHYDGFEWHVTGVTAKQMDENTPTRWNRYAVAERIIAL